VVDVVDLRIVDLLEHAFRLTDEPCALEGTYDVHGRVGALGDHAIKQFGAAAEYRHDLDVMARFEMPKHSPVKAFIGCAAVSSNHQLTRCATGNRRHRQRTSCSSGTDHKPTTINGELRNSVHVRAPLSVLGQTPPPKASSSDRFM